VTIPFAPRSIDLKIRSAWFASKNPKTRSKDWPKASLVSVPRPSRSRATKNNNNLLFQSSTHIYVDSCDSQPYTIKATTREQRNLQTAPWTHPSCIFDIYVKRLFLDPAWFWSFFMKEHTARAWLLLAFLASLAACSSCVFDVSPSVLQNNGDPVTISWKVTLRFLCGV